MLYQGKKSPQKLRPCSSEPRLEPGDLARLFDELLVARVHRLRLWATLTRRQPRQFPALARCVPHRQVRGVQSLTPQQRAQLARLRAAQRSASRNTRSFSAAVNRRRRAFATTSVCAANGRPSVIVDIMESRLALYTKLPAVRCLTYVGREGP